MDFRPQPTPEHKNPLNNSLEAIYSEMRENGRRIDAEIEKRDIERDKQDMENKRIDRVSKTRFWISTGISILAIIASVLISILLNH